MGERRGEEKRREEGSGSEPLSLCICLQPTEPSDAHLMLHFGKDKTTKHSSNACLLQLEPKAKIIRGQLKSNEATSTLGKPERAEACSYLQSSTLLEDLILKTTALGN